MKTSQEIKALFNELPVGVQNSLLGELLIEQELQGKVLQNAQESLIQKRKNKPCPHCSSTQVYKRGKQNGVQMCQCKECKKWYSETTGTPLYDIKLKSKWQSYLRCMEQGMPIKKISKGIYTKLIFLICFLMINLSSMTAQIKVIYETDMDTDIDDASALGMLHALADNGVVDLLAVMHNTSDHYGPGYIDAVNTFYGRQNLPIGSYKRDDAVSRDIGNLHTSARPGAKYNNCPEYVHRIVLDPRFPSDIQTRDDVPSATALYKEILSKQENHSVTIISVGYLLNLEYLIKDSLGLELVKQKVNHVVVLGGNWFPKNERHVMGMNLGGNQINTRAGMATMYVLDNWPTPIHFSGNSISKKYFLGDNLKNTPENNPIREAYKIYKPEKPTWNHHLADLTAVYYTVYSETKPEEWILDSVGTPQAGFAFKPIPHLYNIWNTSKDSQHLLWKLKDNKFEEVSMRIAELIIQPPRKNN